MKKIWCCSFPLLILVLVSCSVYQSVPNTPQENAVVLDTDLVWENKQEHESVSHGIAISFPSDWSIADSDIIWLAPNESEFLWNTDAILEQESYMIYTTGSYTGIRSHRLRIPQTAASVAQFIANTMSGSLTEPVTPVNINGRDGAIFLVSDGNRHHYTIVLRVTDDKAVILGADGPASRSKEMKSILNAIALNIQPLED